MSDRLRDFLRLLGVGLCLMGLFLLGAAGLLMYRQKAITKDSTTNAGFETKDRDAMQKLVDEKPAGSKVELLYNPEDNGRIILAEELLSKNSPVLKIVESGSACLVIGFVLILVGPRLGGS